MENILKIFHYSGVLSYGKVNFLLKCWQNIHMRISENCKIIRQIFLVKAWRKWSVVSHFHLIFFFFLRIILIIARGITDLVRTQNFPLS